VLKTNYICSEVSEGGKDIYGEKQKNTHIVKLVLLNQYTIEKILILSPGFKNLPNELHKKCFHFLKAVKNQATLLLRIFISIIYRRNLL
jgi:hypothetical protein